jgi:hypothetical protein
MAKKPEIKIKRNSGKKSFLQKFIHNLTFGECCLLVLVAVITINGCLHSNKEWVHHTYAQTCQFNTSTDLDEATMIDNAHACIKEALAKR